MTPGVLGLATLAANAPSGPLAPGGLLALGLAIAWAWMVWMTAWTLTRPARRTYASALRVGRPGDPSELPPGPIGPRAWRAWSFRSRGLELPAWDIEGDDPSGPLVVMTHGWGDSRVGGLTRAASVAPVCRRVVLWDLPGHGEAPGTCALGTREVEDLERLLECLLDSRADARPDPRDGVSADVVLMGWSLGAGVSIACAARRGVAGVIAEAPYRLPETPARGVLGMYRLPHATTLRPALALVGLRAGVGAAFRSFDRAELAAGLRCPLLVIHGTDDPVCPIEDGRAIAARACRGATMIEIEGGGHYGLWTSEGSRDRCARAVAEFVASIGRGAKG